MRIREFLIQRYGPINDFAFKEKSNFTLFFGKNESGKTLAIDAIIKFLLNRKGDRKIFDRLDRVEEEPHGYLIIQGFDGREFKLPEKGDITSLFDVTASSARNIFVIRNADLAISEEEKVFGDVTERLTGLRTREIVKIKKVLQKLGRLTNPTSDAGLSNNQEAGRARSKVDSGRELIERIDNLLIKSQEEGLDRIEEEISAKKAELDLEKVGVKSLEDAKNRESYERTLKEIGNIERAMEALPAIESFSADGLQAWRDSLRDIERAEQDLHSKTNRLGKLETEYDERIAIYAENTRKFKGSEEIYKGLNQKLKYKLAQFEEIEKVAPGVGKPWSPMIPLMILAGIISVISLILFAFLRPVFLLIIAVFSLAALIGSGIFIMLQLSKNGRYRKLQSEILFEAARLGFEAERVLDVMSKIAQFENEHASRRTALDEEHKKVTEIEAEIGILKKDVENNITLINSLKENISEIKLKSGAESLDDYLRKFNLKKKFDVGMNASMSILDMLHGSNGETLEDKMKLWKEKLAELEGYKGKSEGLIFNSKNYDESRLRIKNLEDEIESLRQKLMETKIGLSDVGRIASDVVGGEEVYCNYFSDLINVKERVRSIVDIYLKEMQVAQHAIRIFEEISADESQKVKDLFGEGSKATKYFKYITGGDYVNVNFEPDGDIVIVERNDGVRFRAGDLSQGTFDQLYLAIRLSLADIVLKEEPGFFIFDDPFLTSDEERLINQLDVLQELAKSGWQILYFTVKTEVIDKLSSTIKRGNVDRIDLSPIYTHAQAS
ncbi:MAG: AAA family ATPase [Actinobacteria bacterium]|nr:AAA family ATPase [Actinomycetota bacterium]